MSEGDRERYEVRVTGSSRNFRDSRKNGVQKVYVNMNGPYEYCRETTGRVNTYKKSREEFT